MRKYTYQENRRMRSFGDIDFNKRIIRVNSSKGDIIDTILHEEMHRKYPNLKEKDIRRRVKNKIKKLSMKKQYRIIGDFLRKKKT